MASVKIKNPGAALWGFASARMFHLPKRVAQIETHGVELDAANPERASTPASADAGRWHLSSRRHLDARVGAMTGNAASRGRRRSLAAAMIGGNARL